MSEAKPISLSHSSLQVLQSCPRRWEMSRIEGIQRKGITRGRRRGSAFSDALEHRDPSKIDELYDGWMLDAVSQNLIDDLTIERQVIHELYRAHTEYFGDDHEREVAFDLPIEGADPRYRNRGRIDGLNRVVIDIGEGMVDQLEEDKLMMMWGQSKTNALPLNGQVLRYLGASEKYDRIRYRVTKYPGAYRKKDESPRQYADKVCMQIRTKLAKKPEELFVVVELTRSELQPIIDDYHRDLAKRVAEVEWRTATDNWPGAYGDACEAYGGCEFQPVCKHEDNYQDLYEIRERSK